jgi:hypothetical protein
MVSCGLTRAFFSWAFDVGSEIKIIRTASAEAKAFFIVIEAAATA